MKPIWCLSVFLMTSSVLRAEVDVFADFLIWCARQSAADNWGQVFTTEGTTTKAKLLGANFGCDFGLRVGFDYRCCWDFTGSYTWFQATGKNSAQTDGEIATAFLGNFYINNTDGSSFGPSYRQGEIHWKISFNIFDAIAGKTFCPDPCFSLSPYIGLKGGWIHQDIDTGWKFPVIANPTFVSAAENIRNDFWGIGPQLGFSMDWTFWQRDCNAVGLFNDASGSLMYGHWDLSDVYRNDGGGKVTIDTPSINGAATMFRDFLGLFWQRDGGRYEIKVRLGYEAQIWLGQLKFYSLNVGRIDNPFTLQGGTLDVRLGF